MNGSTATANTVQLIGDIHPEQPFTDLQLPNGQIVSVPTHLLRPTTDAAALEQTGDFVQDGEMVIPVIEEQVTVGKRTVATGKVILRKTVQEFQQTLDEPLAVSTFQVERVPVNLVVAEAPAVRREGATTIYPVVEEQLVLTKELVLREEVRVTQREAERRHPQVVTLRREDISVERTPLAEPR